MKVMHVAETTIGGIASHLVEILPLQVEVFGKGNVTLLMPENGSEFIPELPGLNIELFKPARSRFHSAAILSRRMREFAREHRPDIVHAHSSFAGLAARLFGGAGSTPVIYCPHAWSFSQDVPMWKKRLYAAAERFQQKRTSFVVNVSHYERAIALDFGIPDDGKLIVIENGIAINAPEEDFPVPEMKLDHINLAFVGRPSYQKGLDILIEAAWSLQNEKIAFHLVGPSRELNPDILEGIPDTMSVYGWQPREFALSLIAKVDALIMPSRWEGLPMIGIEAMRAGKAIIASNRTALPELVDDGKTGILVDIDRPDALASTLRGMSRPALHSMGVAGRKKFEDRYTAEDQIAKFVELYKRAQPA